MSELVVFEVGSQKLGLPSDQVQELLRAVAVTPLAGSPAGVEGVVDIRGAVVPVFDLRARFSLPARAVRPGDHMLVCSAGDDVVAIRADRVVEILPSFEIDKLPADADPMMRALARLPDGIVVICDLAAILTAADRDALRTALEALR